MSTTKTFTITPSQAMVVIDSLKTTHHFKVRFRDAYKYVRDANGVTIVDNGSPQKTLVTVPSDLADFIIGTSEIVDAPGTVQSVKIKFDDDLANRVVDSLVYLKMADAGFITSIDYLNHNTGSVVHTMSLRDCTVAKIESSALDMSDLSKVDMALSGLINQISDAVLLERIAESIGVNRATKTMTVNYRSSGKLNVSVTIGDRILRDGETTTITFGFDKDPETAFTGSDLAVTNGTFGAFSGTGLVRQATFTKTGVDPAVIRVDGLEFVGPVAEIYGPIQVSMSVFDSSILINGTTTVTFEYDVDLDRTLTLADLGVSGGTLSQPTDISGNGTVWRSTFTANGSVGTATVSIVGNDFDGGSVTVTKTAP